MAASQGSSPKYWLIMQEKAKTIKAKVTIQIRMDSWIKRLLENSFLFFFDIKHQTFLVYFKEIQPAPDFNLPQPFFSSTIVYNPPFDTYVVIL
jgi:hypothetical protein